MKLNKNLMPLPIFTHLLILPSPWNMELICLHLTSAIDCYVKPGHYDFLVKTLSLKTHCPFWFLLLWEYCFNRVLFPGWVLPSKFPQKKNSPLLPEPVLGCSICQRILVPQMWSWHCDLMFSPGSLSAFMLGSCPLPCKALWSLWTLVGATHGCQVADFPQFPY